VSTRLNPRASQLKRYNSSLAEISKSTNPLTFWNITNMTEHIFNRKTLKKKLNLFDLTNVAELQTKRNQINQWKESINKGVVKASKEESLQGKFLEDIFFKVLGYYGKIENPNKWNLEHEKKTLKDGTKADGALGFFTLNNDSDIHVVIELKAFKQGLGNKQNREDYPGSPVDQAFTYLQKSGENCKWAIVSNFNDIWLLHRGKGSTHCEKFQIEQLSEEEEFKRFYYLLSCEHLIQEGNKSLIDQLFEDNQAEEEAISKKFYQEFKQARLQLFDHLKKNNQNIDEISLFSHTQKILDRFIFVCFSEDIDMLPERVFRKAIKTAQMSFNPSDCNIWRQVTGLFHSIDQGNPHLNINKYNGGLFAKDDALDALIIKDEIFEPLARITDYDFETDLNANILGHIFEQSITDIEEIKADILGEPTDTKKGKRKKDGIYYTPAYITKYIVEQAVGGWLNEQKKQLQYEALPKLEETDLTSIKFTNKGYKASKNLTAHIHFWENYREKLSNIKVLDPACGSGAFLIQIFDYLYSEGQTVNKTISDLFQGQTSIFDLEKHILQNNIYGVDLNEESVEITKLSLWLKTAHKDKELTALDNNIKCGNSLIDDPEYAGKQYFDWNEEFPQIMKKGGFDVVVGNPPYVRQEALGEVKPYFQSKYQCYAGTADLFTYFYEKGLHLLKENGYFSFISNTFFKTSAGANLRSYLKNNSRFISLTDFSDIQVFEDATTYPIIPVLKKSQLSDTLQYFKVRTEDLLALEWSKNKNSFAVDQNKLKDENWTFESETEQKLKEKIRQYPVVKELFGKCFRGLVTGFNEAFIITSEKRKEIISRNPKEAEVIKPLFEGKDLKKWNSPDIDKWLIFLPWHFPLHEDQSITGASKNAEKQFEIQYPIIYEHVFMYKDKLNNRNKTETGIRYEWYALQRCAASYLNEFSKPKIIWPNLQSGNKFAFDEAGFYINAPAVILPANNKSLLCILNSRLAWFFFQDICVIRSGGFIEMKPQYFEQLPVAMPNDEQPFIEKADCLISTTKDLQNCQLGFLKFMISELKPVKISKKLNNWIDLDWDSFKAELGKGKAKLQELSLKDRKEWQEYFEEEKKKTNTLRELIRKTEKEIDQMVYALYGLTDDEITIIENI